MVDVNAVLDANRAAVRELVACAERCEKNWSVPRAPGKWSPGEVVEHVSRTFEQSANVIAGRQSLMPRLPFFLRPIARMFLNRMIRTGVIPKGRAAKALHPTTVPATSAEGRTRLEATFEEFDRACRSRATTSDTITSGVFGTVPLHDYARFVEIHTRHHCKQMGPP